MTPKEFFNWVAAAVGDEPTMVTIAPGPFSIKVGPNDVRAMVLLNHLVEQYPDMAMGDLTKTLDAARWWAVFWASVPNEQVEQVGGGLCG